MPRMLNTPKSSTSVRTGGKLTTRGAAPEQKLYEYKVQEKESCPLCIEDLDSTDLEFSPCPCGYRVCLFCFEQLKIHCKSQCPGCRREYGKALEEGDVARPRDDASSGRPDPGARSSPQCGSSSGSSKGRVDSNPGKRSMEEVASSGAALPSGATWGATAASKTTRKQSVEIARPPPTGATAWAAAPVRGAADEAAWPSLASVSTNSTNRQRLDDQGRRRSNNASAASSMDAVEISEQEELQRQQQRGKPSDPAAADAAGPAAAAKASAQQSSNSAAARLMALLHKADDSAAPANVGEGAQKQHQAGSSKDAAARLMALLQRNEKTPPQVYVPTSLASPNPVAPAVPLPETSYTHSLSPLNNLDNPVVPSPPLGRYSPISPPVPSCANGEGFDIYQHGFKQQEHMHKASYMQHQNVGTYSVWSGLPGLELCTPALPYEVQWQGMGVGLHTPRGPFYQGPPGMGAPRPYEQPQQRPVAFKAPPPGFGGPMLPPPPGFGSNMRSSSSYGSVGSFEGMSNPYRVGPPPGFSCMPNEGYAPQHGDMYGSNLGVL